LFGCTVFGVIAALLLRENKFSEIWVWTFGAIVPVAAFLILGAYVFPDKDQ
jgi:nicotinamide riboside transporter PnuC